MKNRIFRPFAFLTAIFVLSACFGYTPLYQTNAPVTLGTIAIVSPTKNVGERRVAQIVQQELARRFVSTSKENDTLTIQIERRTSNLAVREDATAERSQITLIANVQLTRPDGSQRWQERLTVSAAYNVEDTPLSTDVGRTSASEDAAISLATDITRRIHTVYAQQ